DTVNNVPITGLTTSDVIVKNYQTGTRWDRGDFNWKLFASASNGYYILNISLNELDSGWYTLSVNVSNFPNYNYSIQVFSFYLRGNYTTFNLESFSHPGGILQSESKGYNYTIFEGSDPTLTFNITDNENSNQIVNESLTIIRVRFTSSANLNVGRYLINVTVGRVNFENATFSFNLTIIAKYQVNVSIINAPTSVHAGKAFNITFYARYFNGTAWLPLSGSQIRLTPIFDGLASTPIGPYMTNATGYVTFEIEIPKYATTMVINVSLSSEYYHEDLSFQVSSINVIPTATGVDLSFLIFILIIIGIALGSVSMMP
ncbi:MAG: hypothetical protein ACTSSM_16740, partial [Promethearchaeota archaeon]